jgi:hypothetical protein
MPPPEPEDPLPPGPHRDQRERWLRGERVPAETYRDQSSTLRNDPEALIALVWHEILLREELGERPALEEYVARFPALGDGLRQRFAVRQTLRESPLTRSHTPDTAPPTAAAGPDRPSPRIPGYADFHFVDSGGQADVWRARQTGLDRVVA